MCFSAVLPTRPEITYIPHNKLPRLPTRTLHAFATTCQQWSFSPYLMSSLLSRTYINTSPYLHPIRPITLPTHHTNKEER